MNAKKLSTIVKHLKALDEQKSDETVFASNGCWFNELTSNLVVPNSLFRKMDTVYEMTPWALSQACQRMGHIPYGYAKECPPDLRATNLNHWRQKLPNDRKWFLRFNENSCRAVLSDRYTPLANSTLAESLLEILGDSYEIVRPYYDADVLHLKFRTMADPDDSNFGYGVYVGNGETGNRALTVAGFIQRNSCSNSIIITDEKYRRTHVNTTPTEYLVMVKMWVAQAMKLAVDQRERLAAAALEQIEDFSSVVESLCKKNGLTHDVKDKILMGSEGASNLFGLVNGLSWAAHQQDDPELTIDLETLAGDVLVGKKTLTKRVQVLSLATYERQQEEEEV